MKWVVFILLFTQVVKDWVSVSDAVARFSVDMPLEPVQSRDSIDSDVGMVYIKTFTCSEGDLIYMANLTTYPDDINFFNKEDSLSDYLIGAIRDQMISQLNGDLTYQYSREFDGIPGEVFQVTFGLDSSVVKMAVIPFFNHLLTLQHFCDYNTRQSKDIDRFFDSFHYMR